MFIRLAIATVVAVVISGFYQGYVSQEGLYTIDLTTMLSFLAATVITVLLGQFNKAGAGDTSSESFSAHDATSSSNDDTSGSSAAREEGVVKWFNVSKGFGFITRSNGEEIFVHYRSIRETGQNHGRRRLFENQEVSFAVVDSHKGLQADDVDVIQ